jgi:ubiquinone/menaquinone biosynthesis C-methylase UbiE
MTSTQTNRFGGERLDSKSALAKNNLLEHLIRYDFVTGNPDYTVLDIGCGSGHGSNTLSTKFKTVHGVDIAEEAITYAKEYWQQPNIHFSLGNSMDIPFPENTFDVVVAFEVFEHLNDWRKFLSEIKRVLKPNGLVYVSTPNKTLYSPGTKKPINPHHVFEMTIPEFRDAMNEYFALDALYGQRTPVYNDHWIWKVVNPILFTFKRIIPYKWNNTLKLKIINWIKPELEAGDIILKSDPDWLERSRFMVAVCGNNK